VATVVNRNPRTRDWLRMAFLPDYNVSAMEQICPGADLSSRSATTARKLPAQAT
jgi:starch phosphorylase